MRSPTEPVADLKALTGVQHKEPSRLQGRHAVRDGAHWRLAAMIAGRSFAHEAPASRSNGFAGDAERDAQYFRRRWGEARHAALEAAGPASRAAHEELAARYALLSQPTGRPESALPGRAESADHARLAGVVVTESPLPLPRFEISMVVPRVALADSGLAWLNAALREAAASGGDHPARRTRASGRR